VFCWLKLSAADGIQRNFPSYSGQMDLLMLGMPKGVTVWLNV
jgi:hypothetical protein